MTSRTRYLIDDLNRTHQSFQNTFRNPQQSARETLLSSRSKNSNSKKLSQQKTLAKHNYQHLTNMTKQQQRQLIWQQMLTTKKHKKQWTHTHYTGNNKLPHASKTFSVFQKQQLQQYPHNNKKYNIQFLDRSLHGTSLKFPRSQSGQFKKPSNRLYSKHYRPIVRQIKKVNQDYQLRTSMFGKTWVDHKRDRIMNKYQIQKNPFKTPRSNSLISQMSQSEMF